MFFIVSVVVYNATACYCIPLIHGIFVNFTPLFVLVNFACIHPLCVTLNL